MRNVPFKARKINKHTYVIEGLVSYAYLLLGKEKALLIDTGMRYDNLRKFLEKITDLPIEVVNTHGHSDHVCANPYFDKVYMHIKAKEDALLSYDKIKDELNGTGNYDIETVVEGDVFELGERKIEVIEIACHSSGDIALLDRENRMIFTGDNLESDQVLLFYGDGETGASISGHLEIMNKLKGYENYFDIICPGHNGTPLDKEYLYWMIENDKRILSGVQGKAELYSPTFNKSFPLPPDKKYVRCSQYKGTAIIYDIRRVNGSKSLYSDSLSAKKTNKKIRKLIIIFVSVTLAITGWILKTLVNEKRWCPVTSERSLLYYQSFRRNARL